MKAHWGLAAAGLVVAALAGIGSGAAAVGPVTCGGQSWNAQAPITCTRTRTVDGTSFTVVLTVGADGYTVIDYQLAWPRAVDTPINVTSHTGISSKNGPKIAVRGVIPAGRTDGRLTIERAYCGQFDVRAVYEDSRGRITGPTIDNGTCAPSPPSTVTTTTTPGTAPPTSLIPPITTRATVPGGPLPATGGVDRTLGWIGLACIAVGGVLLVLTLSVRRPR